MVIFFKSSILSLEKETMASPVDLPLVVAAFCWRGQAEGAVRLMRCSVKGHKLGTAFLICISSPLHKSVAGLGLCQTEQS